MITKKFITRQVWSNITPFSTLILAIGTVCLALVSCRQIGIMEADQRPWVGVKSEGIVDSPEFITGGYYHLEIVNSGKSPALDVTVTLLNWNTDINNVQFPIPKCTSECREQNMEMVPGFYSGMLIPEIDKTPLPKAGDTGYIIARVDYHDSKGTPYVTGICYKSITTVVTTVVNNVNKTRVIDTNTSCAVPKSNYAT